MCQTKLSDLKQIRLETSSGLSLRSKSEKAFWGAPLFAEHGCRRLDVLPILRFLCWPVNDDGSLSDPSPRRDPYNNQGSFANKWAPGDFYPGPWIVLQPCAALLSPPKISSSLTPICMRGKMAADLEIPEFAILLRSQREASPKPAPTAMDAARRVLTLQIWIWSLSLPWPLPPCSLLRQPEVWLQLGAFSASLNPGGFLPGTWLHWPIARWPGSESDMIIIH